MSIYFTVWVSLGLLSHLLTAGGAVQCSEKETLLKSMPSTGPQLTDCLMECTWLTYIRKLQLKDKRNIRLQDSTEGERGEYCWPTDIKCKIGETFQHAFVVLPVNVSANGHEQLEVRSASSMLHCHNSSTTIPDTCGLHCEVTEFFSQENRGTSFCIQVVTQQDALGYNVFKCPPYLVSFWQRTQSNQEGGQLLTMTDT